MAFKNKHLSYSRLSRFEQCPLSFKLHYIEKKQAEPGDALRFGKGIHAVLEVLVREHMQQERTGLLSEDHAAELWQKTFTTDGMSGIEMFHEGLTIIGSFIREQGIVDHQDVLQWVSDNPDVNDLVEAVGVDRLLNIIGRDAALEHFGFEVE